MAVIRRPISGHIAPLAHRDVTANALLSIKFLPAFVRTRTFIPFGIYRIVIAVAFALVIHAHG